MHAATIMKQPFWLPCEGINTVSKKTDPRVDAYMSGLIAVTERHYASGFVEVAISRPGATSGCTPVLTAVVERQAGNRKWFVYGDKPRAFSSTNKRVAINWAVAFAESKRLED